MHTKPTKLFVIVLLSLSGIGLYLYYFVLSAHFEVNIQIPSEQQTDFKVYWASEDQDFSENRSNSIRIRSEQHHYSMRIGHLGNITRLRIDPIEYLGTAKIVKLDITQPGFAPVTLDSRVGLSKLEPVQQLNPLAFHKDTLLVRSTGTDGQFLLPVQPLRTSIVPLVHIANVLAIVALAILIYSLANRARNLVFVPFALVAILVLAAVMATITNYNVHPDEKPHFKAVQYYTHDLLPPAVDNPAMEGTYSEFGISRLLSQEIYYPVAGYFSRILSPLNLSELINARLFGLALLAILLATSALIPAFRWFTLPLLVTPQAWYLYSYINSDSFALTMAIVVAYQAAVPQSMLNRYLVKEHVSRFWVQSASLGMLTGTLFLLKPNYYFFLLFLGLYLIWRIGSGDFPNQKRLLKRLGLLLAIGLCLPATRFGLEIRANGFDFKEQRAQKTEETAEYWYRPGTPLENKHVSLYNYARGLSLDHLIHYKKWGEKMMASSFGSYGYAQLNPSQSVYHAIQVLCIGMFMVILLSVLIHGPPATHVLFALVSISAIALIASSLTASWHIVFQPQGRYLAPILAMTGILLYHIRDHLIRWALYPLVGAMFSLAFYSFVFTGLRFLEKTYAG